MNIDSHSLQNFSPPSVSNLLTIVLSGTVRPDFFSSSHTLQIFFFLLSSSPCMEVMDYYNEILIFQVFFFILFIHLDI